MGDRGARLAMVVTAAGRGARFGSDVSKQYVYLAGVPLLQRTLAALESCEEIEALVVVTEPDQVRYCEDSIVSDRFAKVVAVVGGGDERALSVREGLRALEDLGRWDLAGVHDGARPLVTCDEIRSALAALAADPGLAGAVIGVPSSDTMKTVDGDGIVTGTPQRESLWRAQTPQIFRWQAFVRAYGLEDEVLASATDDSALVERTGGRVKVVEGSHQNLKITVPADLKYAEGIIAERER